MANLIPTKGNLMAAKRSRTLAEDGYELMDKKRNILVRELLTRIDEAKELQKRIDGTFRAAYDALRTAEVALGGCADIAANAPVDESVRLRWRSVMGVEIASVAGDEPDQESLPYSFADTGSALDEAYRRFTEVKKLLAQLAETETAVYRLAFAIKKSQKRANALQNIVIPGLEADIRRISEALEEKEREEFVRLKVVKARKTG
jgi:V/A-type H+-transporting ATPase subunit D